MVFTSPFARSLMSILSNTENEASSAAGSAARKSVAWLWINKKMPAVTVNLMIVLTIRARVMVANLNTSSQVGDHFHGTDNRARPSQQRFWRYPRRARRFSKDRSGNDLWISRG